MRVAIVVSFLNEAEHLPVLLRTMAAQTVLPDRVLLVDDGSTDASADLAEAFAVDHPWATALRRPQRPAEDDRLLDAAELKAFNWGAEQLAESVDVIAKMDADLELSPHLVASVREAFLADPKLGMTGSYLSIRRPDGTLDREPTPSDHVRGPNKFYRWTCFEQIGPLPAFLGWDTIDDLRAERAGWSVRSLALEGGDCVHLRPTGLYDGRLRAFRRWGRCAWGYGAHPLWVLGGAVSRARMRPRVLCGLNYLWGWAWAAVRRVPRVEAETRQYARRKQLGRLRSALSRPR